MKSIEEDRKVDIRMAGAENELEQLSQLLQSKGAKVLREVTHKAWELKNFAVTGKARPRHT